MFKRNISCNNIFSSISFLLYLYFDNNILKGDGRVREGGLWWEKIFQLFDLFSMSLIWNIFFWLSFCFLNFISCFNTQSLYTFHFIITSFIHWMPGILQWWVRQRQTCPSRCILMERKASHTEVLTSADILGDMASPAHYFLPATTTTVILFPSLYQSQWFLFFQTISTTSYLG